MDYSSETLLSAAQGEGTSGERAALVFDTIRLAINEAFSKIAIPPDVQEKLDALFGFDAEKADAFAAALAAGGKTVAPPVAEAEVEKPPEEEAKAAPNAKPKKNDDDDDGDGDDEVKPHKRAAVHHRPTRSHR